jgi:hypothetical protein
MGHGITVECGNCHKSKQYVLGVGEAYDSLRNVTSSQTMGDSCSISITRIVHEGEESEPASKDYDFSRTSIGEHKEVGYKIAGKILEKEAPRRESKIRA